MVPLVFRNSKKKCLPKTRCKAREKAMTHLEFLVCFLHKIGTGRHSYRTGSATWSPPTSSSAVCSAGEYQLPQRPALSSAGQSPREGLTEPPGHLVGLYLHALLA